MALKGIRVLEMAGLAPAPFCGMILSDFGASVIRVDRNGGNSLLSADKMARGKRSISVNLKDKKGQKIVQRLAATADVLIEPFRPGVMEKLNLGPEKLMSQNPSLIYARLSGYGQTGPFIKKAGHDINYVAMSGMLSMLGRKDQNPTPPINLVADFAGGGLTCAFGILISLFERTKSGQGQIVDTSMVEGSAYVSSFIFKTQELPIWGRPRGQNWLDTGAHFYDTYKTKDGKWMAVGALEPQFYHKFMEGLLGHSDSDKFIDQFADFEEGKAQISKIFLTKTRAEWETIFDEFDACVTPVLEMEEAPCHALNKEREAFVQNEENGRWEPQPAPKLSRTPGTVSCCKDPEVGEHSIEVLEEMGLKMEEIQKLIQSGSVGVSANAAKL
ncbi:alpha-methylacyl-CoA racemase [Folsomia candida]|uniref:alpha-methylacyl-CoA racemase n=1 Tax=Folsomia candida TaxID=158441 RepID=UPI000B8F5F7F|nr:alpha-methylacyl-CoA racemase [Folsomia candida]